MTRKLVETLGEPRKQAPRRGHAPRSAFKLKSEHARYLHKVTMQTGWDIDTIMNVVIEGGMQLLKRAMTDE